MGRHYNGDIEGKFWFGVQSSCDAEFFGVDGYEPSFINYYFDTDNLPNVKSGVNKCKEALGEYKEKLDEFFKDKDGYNEDMIIEELEISRGKVAELLEWYARLELGLKIQTCLEETGECSFEAEL